MSRDWSAAARTAARFQEQRLDREHHEKQLEVGIVLRRRDRVRERDLHAGEHEPGATGDCQARPDDGHDLVVAAAGGVGAGVGLAIDARDLAPHVELGTEHPEHLRDLEDHERPPPPPVAVGP